MASAALPRPRDLRVRGGEVVVPEERHLLLERAVRMHHPEQPPLARVGDDGARRKRVPAARDLDVPGLQILRVDIVVDRLVVEQEFNGTADGLSAERVELVAAGAEAGASKQMLELAIEEKRHVRSLRTLRRRFRSEHRVDGRTGGGAPTRDGWRREAPAR